MSRNLWWGRGSAATSDGCELVVKCTGYYRRTVALFAKPTCALFSFLCWSSLLEIHIMSNYKGLLQSDEMCNKEKKEKKSRNFLWPLENHILTILIKWNKRSLNQVFYLLCVTASATSISIMKFCFCAACALYIKHHALYIFHFVSILQYSKNLFQLE